MSGVGGPRRLYGDNENLTLSEADLYVLGQTRQPGEWIRAYCPLHGSDHQRSLSVNSETGYFRCHACGAWGYMEWARESYRREHGLRDREDAPPERRPTIRRRPEPPGPRPVESVRDDLQELQAKFAAALPGSWGERYLEHRGIPLELARAYGVGYAGPGEWPGRGWKGGRLTAPHTRPDGITVNLYGRAVARGEVPKGGKHDHLPGNKGYFNARALHAGEGPIYVVEGLLDALAMIAAGGRRSVAIFSTRDWRWEWVGDEARRSGLVLALDGDEAGAEGRGRLAGEARLRGIPVFYLDAESYGGEKDPAAAFATGRLDIGEWLETSPRRVASGEVTAVPEAADTANFDLGSAAEREASRVLYRLYSEGIRLELRGGELQALREAGLTASQRSQIRDHEEALAGLLSEEVVAALWERALGHIAEAAGADGYEQASRDVEAAQDAYECGEYGMCRYLLQRAALAARAPGRGEVAGDPSGESNSGSQ